MSLLSLVYVSSATTLLSPEQLRSILETSRRNNTRDGISGMLLYKDGNIMQAIEGEADILHHLHAKILRDPRHHSLITLLERPVAERQFPDWSMGFQNLTDPGLRATPGYSEFLDVSLQSDEMVTNPSRALRLLDTFRRKM